MPRILLGVLYVALVVYALVDVAQSDDEDRSGLPKIVWFGAIIFLPLVGSIAWIVLASISRRNRGRAAANSRGYADRHPTAAAPRPDAPPAGPEDDPEYMWLLEQERRKKAREERRRAEQGDDASDGESAEDEDRPQNGDRPDEPPA